EHLSNLQRDPVALLANLPKTYNIADKMMVQNIPDELRRMPLDEVKLGMERFLDSPAARRGNANPAQSQAMIKSYVTAIEQLINESDELLIGLGIDEPAKHIVLDIGYSARESTALARQMAMQAD